ncbi:BH2829 [Halalkalibacterium halodurans C-125]|uniref:BH2829 protein n=2 Tax=Halalkalibacterium halodurans TaxID=86665 RepID=Q9K922_HALH5|nr:BH2829 [Halalkalibacterium halodurans C-125]
MIQSNAANKKTFHVYHPFLRIHVKIIENKKGKLYHIVEIEDDPTWKGGYSSLLTPSFIFSFPLELVNFIPFVLIK